MVFTVRCFKCGEQSVRLVLGGRSILHARCQACNSNLLEDVLGFEEQILRTNGPGEKASPLPVQDTDEPNTREIVVDPDDEELFGDSDPS